MPNEFKLLMRVRGAAPGAFGQSLCMNMNPSPTIMADGIGGSVDAVGSMQ